MKALSLAVTGMVTEYVIPSFKKIDSFLEEWSIDIKDQRELFLAIANVLRENKRYCTIIITSSSVILYLVSFFRFHHDFCLLLYTSSLVKESLKFLTKYLATFSNEDTLDEAKEEAVRAVIEFVKASSIFQVFVKA